MPLLQATQVSTAQIIDLADGSQASLLPGDWIIRRQNTVLDTAKATRLDERYETVAEGGMQLSAETCRALDETLGFGAAKDPQSLRAAVDRLAYLSIGEIRIPFTPGQLEEIAHRAGKRGRSVQQELQAVVDRVRDELFYRS